ncbi:Ubiquitin carboxyl-terminal hydrolase 10 [Sporothrix stenoceras]|uniref:Ubiquitin carboxyl-terminal hydrolase 10 n=1 Tax=Sporothrix stenoceras TaxID=5173 RepID=A0ABR3YUA2_9PEZI
MAKRRAAEDLDATEGVTSPAPKKQRNVDGRDGRDGREELLNGRTSLDEVTATEVNDGDDNDEEETAAPLRQAAPTAGYDDLYLDSIDRHVLDFDFEKLCSVSLSHINVYACLVCGRYYQGRGPKSHAYFHALDEGHHVYINMQTQRVYVLPEGYEVLSKSLDDIKFVADPRYTRSDVAQLDRRTATSKICYTLAGKPYTPGFVGMNNIKENDYLNVVVQALAHVPPLRNFFLLDEFSSSTASKTHTNAELVKRFGLLVRKIWNPRAFKAHVSPHELLQEVALRSNRRFTLTAQADPVDFLTWFLNHLHLGLGGSRTRPGSSIVQRVFQGKVRVESEKLEAVGASAAAAAAAKAAETNGGSQPSPQQSPDSMMIDAPLPVRPGGSMAPPPPPGMGSHPSHHQHQMPPPGLGGAPGQGPFAQMPPPPGVSSDSGMFNMPPPSLPPGVSSGMGQQQSSLPPSPSSLPPPPSFSQQLQSQQQQQQQETPSKTTTVAPVPTGPTVDISRFLLLTLDLPAAPLFQDEQERNIIPQVALTTLLGKYDGQSAHTARVDQSDVRRRFQLQGPLPPYLILHMKRFSVNKFITERNPTIVTFDPRGLNMRPYVDNATADDGDYTYDLVANVVHEAERARGDDVAVDSAEEKQTWKVQLRDRSGATAATTANGSTSSDSGDDKWVVAQDLFVEPVAGELLYLAESYIQIWERRRRPTNAAGAGANGKAKAKPTNGTGIAKA